MPYLIHFDYIFKFILLLFSFFPQALRSQWDKDTESTQSNLQKSLSETQNSLTAIQTELSSTQASLAQTNKALTEAQAALSQTQSELQESWARLEELQTSSKEQSEKLEESLKQARADRDAAAREWHPFITLLAIPSSQSIHTLPVRLHNSPNLAF